MNASVSNHRRIKAFLISILVLTSIAGQLCGADKKAEAPKPAPVPSFEPAKQPVVKGEFIVGVVTVTFKESQMPEDIGAGIRSLNMVTGAHNEADPAAGSKAVGNASGANMEEYFKTYSNGIAWPKLVAMPDETICYQDPHFYGYYCEYDYWENPLGWKDQKEGGERVEKMNRNALRFAEKSYRGAKPRFLCYNYITSRPATPATEVTDALRQFYENRGADPDRTRMTRPRRKKKNSDQEAARFDPWTYYKPVCKWGEPMWANSKIQIDNFGGGVLAHELGHCLGAPDLYRVGRFNDGIGGDASLMAYGPTANAFSRFYHHAYIGEKNYPTIKSSGTYTLHPRDIDPKSSEAIGYLIPSNHPHYMYHVEYVHHENSTVGVGPKPEGMIVSVINFGLSSYLGSPDFFYVYRPGDPYFQGKGNIGECLFGKSHKRTEFNMTTEPSSRLPNLMDGGVSFTNIEEHDGTLTFDVAIERHPVTGGAYAKSMLPLVQLEAIRDIQSTSFAMDCAIQFRGEPLITNYGFCWSTSSNPTVRDSNYSLAHRACFRGHAINLTPDTTYYVRAFATNGVGVRYSDEEKTVKTPPFKTTPTSVGPLCTDYFSDNPYLFTEFSNEAPETGDDFVGYGPTCVLAKLIAYYRPDRFAGGASERGSKAGMVDFNNLGWKPAADDPKMRLAEIEGFFQRIYDQGHELNLHSRHVEKDFIRNLVKLTGIRSKPVLSELGPDNMKQVSELIRKDLLQSRPVLIVFSYNEKEFPAPVRWAIIDGIDSSGKFHVDFPHKSKLFLDGGLTDCKSGYSQPDEFLLPLYKTHVITSCYYPK